MVLIPDATGLELIAQELNDAHDGAVVGTYHEHGQACLIADPEQILDLLRWLRDTPGQEYRFLASLHGADYLPAEPRFGVHYELLSMARVERIRVRAALADPGEAALPELDSCVELFPTADFQEREVYDFFGIVFRGHPDPRRILMPEDYVGWPQRRDFPIGGEPVIFTRDEREVPALVRMTDIVETPSEAADQDQGPETHGSTEPRGGDRLARTGAQVIGTSPIERTDPEEREEELLTINMGPHHPATHGVLRLLVSLEGEIVRDLKPIMGYVHTGIEKSCEEMSYWKVIPFVERMEYLSYFFQMQAFCGAVETLLELEIPERAKYLRVLHMELNRIHSHLVWLGTSALDLGAMSMFFYCFRERDRILDLFEMSTGQRMHTRYFQVGGVSEDIPVGFAEKVRAFCDEMPSRIDQYEALLTRNEIFLRRTKGVGVVPRERLLALGVTGPLLRAAGEPWDLRKTQPDLCYDQLDFKIPIGTVGDGWDRYRVRVQEMRESVRLISQTLEGLPEGPWIADDRKVVLPPRHELSTSMEALIHHFKLVTEGFRVPPGEVYYPVESPRGELGCFVVADGSAKPARVHCRDPSFVNLQSLRDMCVGGYVADLIQNLAMLDPILGGIDR